MSCFFSGNMATNQYNQALTQKKWQQMGKKWQQTKQ
jgi:hypothetical protein